jgi:hypothetical protein
LARYRAIGGGNFSLLSCVLLPEFPEVRIHVTIPDFKWQSSKR